MPTERFERRLAAILAADVAGYSRLMGADEAGTLARLRAHRRELIDPKIAEHRGRIVKTTGDGMLVEFPSVVEAVACAVAVQTGTVGRNADEPAERRIQLRVGINLGDVIVEDGDIHGDGVNVAARLEALAEPGGICVSAIVHDQVRGKLDCVFEDLGEQQLKNIARPIRVYGVRSGREASPLSGVAPVLALPDKPSIAVLPFQNLSGDPEQEYFVDGMVEEIITALSRIRWLFVIARNSSFTYKGQAVDVKRVGRELGVRYVLEGSVRKAGGRVRVTAQLIEAATAAHLWADRFDGSLEDVFELQDKVASSVAGVIEPALQAAETARSARRPRTDLSTYDAYLRASATLHGSDEDIPRAFPLLEEAIARNSNYGLALACAAEYCLRLVNDGSSQDQTADRQKGVDYARRALAVARDDPVILASAAYALACFGEDIGAMMALVDRALELNPNYARGWYISAYLRLQAGQPDRAIEHADTMQRLNPRAQRGASYFVIGASMLVTRRFEEAIPKLLVSIQIQPTFPTTYQYLAACYAHLGRLREAREIIAQLRAIAPTVTPPSRSVLRDPEQREVLMSGLRQAMGEAS